MISSEPSRQDTVEDVDPAPHAFHNILRRSHAHQIAWSLLGELFVENLQYGVHLFLAFAYAQPTDSDPRGIEIGDEARRFSA